MQVEEVFRKGKSEDRQFVDDRTTSQMPKKKQNVTKRTEAEEG